MNRRGFLKMLGGGVAGIAIAEAEPLGRVWSFPKNILIKRTVDLDLISGVDLTSSADSSVVVMTSWRRTPEGIWTRRDLAHDGVSYQQIHDWRLTPHNRMPIAVVTPADHRPSHLLSS